MIKWHKYRWYVYLIRCKDGTLYCGISPDPEARLAEHNSGQGAKYICHSRRPAVLIYREGPYTHGEACRREFAVKRLSRKEKLALTQLGVSDD